MRLDKSAGNRCKHSMHLNSEAFPTVHRLSGTVTAYVPDPASRDHPCIPEQSMLTGPHCRPADLVPAPDIHLVTTGHAAAVLWYTLPVAAETLCSANQILAAARATHLSEYRTR